MYERNSRQNLTPASTTKLFSTAAYYQLNGQNAIVSTEVKTDGVLEADGTLRGNLYLIGHGDALLSVNDLEFLADKVRALGIKRITGNIVGDGYAFDGQSNRAVYSGDYEDVQPLPPIVALSVNKGTVAVFASAGKTGRVNVQRYRPRMHLILLSEHRRLVRSQKHRRRESQRPKQRPRQNHQRRKRRGLVRMPTSTSRSIVMVMHHQSLDNAVVRGGADPVPLVSVLRPRHSRMVFNNSW
ncbi:MAG: D-alanyl-D-alanine carboxypeptidase [Ignavibacteria bacterium]|nr:D-alanyl-D-alanine carboxypeptidase [Ignavibacteria bacterium]